MTVRLNTSTNLKGSSADIQTSLIQNYMTAIALLEVKLMLAECDPSFSSPYTGIFELPKREECFLHITSIHKCTAGSAVTAETATPDLAGAFSGSVTELALICRCQHCLDKGDALSGKMPESDPLLSQHKFNKHRLFLQSMQVFGIPQSQGF